jgi:hypothetical protein
MPTPGVSELFDPDRWRPVDSFAFTDIGEILEICGLGQPAAPASCLRIAAPASV